MSQDSIGTARLDLVIETAQFDTAIAAAKRSVSDMSQTAQSDYNRLTTAQKRQVDSLIKQADTIGYTRQQQILYNATLRGVPVSILDDLKTKLAQSGSAASTAGQQMIRSGQAAATATRQMNQYGISAAQQAAALRNVPSQITDIVVSLQGGQAPLTVLLQQGGQLKDMFGGILPAARALGSTILGMVNPYVLAATAVAGLTAAAYAGSNEFSKINTALIQTNRYAGLTADSLTDLARGIADATKSTQSSVTSKLTAVVASGQFAGAAIETVSTAAVVMERNFGQAVDKTIDQFKRLADEPAQASRELNSQYHYLTASVYDQIRALEEQGNKTAAARLASDTFAQAIKTQTPQIQENLGYVQRGWQAITGVIKGATDAAMAFGRVDTASQQIATLEREVRAREDNLRLATEYGSTVSDNERAQVASARARLTLMREERSQDEAKARGRALAQQAEERRIDEAEVRRSYLKARKGSSVTTALEDENTEFKKATQGLLEGTKEYEEVLSSHNARVAQIQKRFKDTTKAYTDDAATRVLEQLRQRGATLREQLDSESKLTIAEKDKVQYAQLFADLKEKRILTADQKSLLARRSEIEAAVGANIEDEKGLKIKQERLRLSALEQTINATAQNDRQQYDDQLAGFGLGAKAQEQLRARQAIYKDFQRQMNQLATDRTTDKITAESFQQQTQLLRGSLVDRLGIQTEYYNSVRALEGDWRNGVVQGYSDYLEKAADVAGATRDLFGSAFRGMEDAAVKYTTTGKLSFSDFARSAIADLARIQTRAAFSGLLGFVGQTVMGLVGGAVGGAGASGGASSSLGLQATSNTGSLTAGSGLGLNTNGFSFGGARAAGGDIRPGKFYEVNEQTPELYTQGNRTWLMAGDSPGYVSPLMKGAGAGSAAPGPISIQTNVYSDGRSDTNVSGGESGLGQRLTEGIKALVQQEMAKSYRQGGMGWNARNGRG